MRLRCRETGGFFLLIHLKIHNILIPGRVDKDEIPFNCHLAINIKRRFEM